MKIFKLLSLSLVLLAISANETLAATGGLAGGDAGGGEMGKFLKGVLGFIDKAVIPLILGIAFLMFVWGVFKFFILGGADSEKQAEGKSLMIYAIAGFVLILSFYGIVNILVGGIIGSSTPGDSGIDKVDTGFDIKASGGSNSSSGPGAGYGANQGT